MSKQGKPAKKTKATMAAGADKYALYRLSVQDPEHEVSMFLRFYKDAYGRLPTSLREDFCAAFAVCCEWVRRGSDRTAVGVDLDSEPLAYGRAHYLPTLTPDQRARVRLLQQDVLQTRERAEVVAAQNYSFFLFKQRAQLLAYFKSVHRSLADEGLLVFDMMGGSAMYANDVVEGRQVARPTPADKQNNPPFRYVWHQERYNPITADALFHIHFRFPDGSAIDNAFTYDWRLWTLPELLELLEEAGFSARHIYWETTDQDGNPSGNYRRATEGRPDPAWLCYVVAQK
ncbi:MAG: class I SAM-dependent methyltransferase [Deltaproteobacteria bacterium]|nr:class I SAM-dependent methyltransferase [Deltaproteobacteria bacterium]